MAWIDEVSEVFAKYKIPQYVWKPIMMMESKGNPLAELKNDIETSRGLYQINIVANPQYAGLDLFNPVVNAEIAAKYFIEPAYKKAQKAQLETPLDITEYVWRYGIRPYWTAEKSQAVRAETEKLLLENSAII